MQSNQESYRLERARSKLEHLVNEYKLVDEILHGYYSMTNGQSMKDKRNGAMWLKKQQLLEEKRIKLQKRIRDQAEFIKMLERRESNKSIEEMEQEKDGKTNKLISSDCVYKYNDYARQAIALADELRKCRHVKLSDNDQILGDELLGDEIK